MTKKPENGVVGEMNLVDGSCSEPVLRQQAEASLERLAKLLEGTTKAQSGIDEMLKSRDKVYGDFITQAAISQRLKDVVRGYRDPDKLEAYHQEALEMIQHKIARILNGDPKYIDSWQDIAGYAMLVVNELKARKKA